LYRQTRHDMHGGAMNQDLQNLVKLQLIDMRIFELKQSKKEYPIEVEKLTAAVREAESVVASLEQKIHDVATERKNVEDQIAQAKLSLSKSEERLNAITTNREYDAVHSEIESQKHTVSNGEIRLKNFGEETERLNQQKEQAHKEVERIRAEGQPKIDDLNAKIASIDSDIESVGRERNALLPGIGRQYQRTYDHIHNRRKNARVISLVSMADGTCAICHRILEPQLVNEVRKGVRLNICESCGSILIWNATEVKEGAAGDGEGQSEEAGRSQ